MAHLPLGRWLRAPTLCLLLAVPRAASAQSPVAKCSMIDGGGAITVYDNEVVFSAASDSLGSTLRAMAIVRASADFRSRRPPAAVMEKWASGQLRHSGGGASVGPLIVVHEAATNTMWFDDSVAVPLAAPNNVLLIDVDARGAFTVVGRARIDPRFPRPVTPCDDRTLTGYYETRDTLWSRFQASVPIRSFVSR